MFLMITRNPDRPVDFVISEGEKVLAIGLARCDSDSAVAHRRMIARVNIVKLPKRFLAMQTVMDCHISK
jgi:hypothetical protein